MKLDTEKLEKYFDEVFPEILPEDEALPLFYLVTGIRPGALIMSAENRDLNPIEQFCEDFELERKFFHSDKNGVKSKGFFIAREQERFNLLKNSEGKFYGCSDTAVGKFLGYNLESVLYYEENENAGMDYRQKVSELVEDGKLTNKETGYLNLICYVTLPEKDKVLKAVARGKKRAEKIREFDERNGTDVGKKFLEEMLDR